MRDFENILQHKYFVLIEKQTRVANTLHITSGVRHCKKDLNTAIPLSRLAKKAINKVLSLLRYIAVCSVHHYKTGAGV